MKEPPKEERKKFLLVLHAVTACDETLRICEQMEKDRIDSNHPFHDALMNYMVAQLVRPFTHSNGLGRANDALWPSNHKKHHEHFKTLRDKFHMHTDKNEIWNNEKPNHFVLKISDSGESCWTATPPLVVDVKLIRDIASEMRQTCRYRIGKFEKKYLLEKVHCGAEYTIDFDDGPFLMKGSHNKF